MAANPHPASGSASAVPGRAAFPPGGRDWDSLSAEMEAMSAKNADFRGGRTPIFFFFTNNEAYEVGKKAYTKYFGENALGAGRAFPGVAAMERGVLDYGLSLLNAPADAAGIFTTGGTESIFLGIKAAREFHRAKPGAKPGAPMNLVMPVTAHPAFDKAALIMDIELRRAPLGADKRVDVAAMAQLADENTMALVGSAPCYPHGVIDPITQIGKIALERNIWLHVDGCVGGWIAPHFRAIGRDIPAFDLSVPGVRSISADLHKFGFCPKPASTVFFADRNDLDRSVFRLDGWPSGVYVTSTFCGTRPAGAVAAAWAVLNHLGTSGYQSAARRLSAMADRFVAGIEAIPGLEFWSKPDLTLMNFGSNEFDVFAVTERMQTRGWVPGLTRNPPGMHLMLAMHHEPALPQYFDDLKASIAEVKEAGAKGTIKAVY